MHFTLHSCVHVHFQADGDREYLLEGGTVTVQLQFSTIEQLKYWNCNTAYNQNFMDAKFLKRLAIDVFGSECLKRSSVLGRAANNAEQLHEPLDPKKLDFMRGMYAIAIQTK